FIRCCRCGRLRGWRLRALRSEKPPCLVTPANRGDDRLLRTADDLSSWTEAEHWRAPHVSQRALSDPWRPRPNDGRSAHDSPGERLFSPIERAQMRERCV